MSDLAHFISLYDRPNFKHSKIILSIVYNNNNNNNDNNNNNSRLIIIPPKMYYHFDLFLVSQQSVVGVVDW